MANFVYFFSDHYRFKLSTEQSPTYSNLNRYLKDRGWTSTRFDWLSSFGERHFQLHSQITEQLEFKHLLAQLVDEYCPHVMPVTYEVNDHNWPMVLNLIAQKYYQQNGQCLDQLEDLAWILKPSQLNNGQHIKIFNKLSDIEHHYLSGKRLGGVHVLQQYLRPHLLKGYKYSIRMFVVLTNDAGSGLYPHGYFNIATHPYQPENLNDTRPHLTNEHLKDDESNVIQIPTQKMEIFPSLFAQIKPIIMDIMNALKKKYPDVVFCKGKRKLALFGFDFMTDAYGRVWLLEVNHGPCFPVNDQHPLQEHLYVDFWQAFIEDYVLPIVVQQKQDDLKYQFFEPLVCS